MLPELVAELLEEHDGDEGLPAPRAQEDDGVGLHGLVEELHLEKGDLNDFYKRFEFDVIIDVPGRVWVSFPHVPS